VLSDYNYNIDAKAFQIKTPVSDVNLNEFIEAEISMKEVERPYECGHGVLPPRVLSS
jgi:hypothetical protein